MAPHTVPPSEDQAAARAAPSGRNRVVSDRRSKAGAKQGWTQAEPIDTKPLPAERAQIAKIRIAAARFNAPLFNAESHGKVRRTILRVGIGDDCAVLSPAARDEIVVTTDLFLEDVHFRRDWHQPEIAGHRCLARGLSDIAAMGANPAAAFLSFALPPELAGDWARRFLDALLRLAARYHLPLAGGDMAQAPNSVPLSIATRTNQIKTGQADSNAHPTALFTADIVLLGTVRRGKALLRGGAKPGDSIYVTGALGGAAAELALLQGNPSAYARLLRARTGHPHLFPQPRLAAGQALLGRASAAIDLSDGLSTDLTHLCEESGVAGEVEASLLPIHTLASGAGDGGLAHALHGGEDYELLFTVPARRRMPPELAGTPVHRVGKIVPAGRGRSRVTLIAPNGSRSRLRSLGWEHFH